MDEWSLSESVQLTITQRVDADHGIIRYHFVQHKQRQESE